MLRTLRFPFPGFLAALAALLVLGGGLAACGDDDDGADDAAPADTAPADDGADGGADEGASDGGGGDEGAGDGGDGAETATATIGDRTFEFTGSGDLSCFITEDGGSQGGISLSDFTSADGAELSMDWAGDSPDASSARIDTADGETLEANSIAGEPFDVSISGSSATVTATFNSFTDPDFGPVEGTIEISC
jgi:hypothetical protein